MRQSYRELLAASGIEERCWHSLWLPAVQPARLPLPDWYFLFLLINYQWTFRPDAERTAQGWFRCTMTDLETAYGQKMGGRWRQMKYLRHLRRYVKRRLDGFPPQRSLWIDFDQVERLLRADWQRLQRNCQQLFPGNQTSSQSRTGT